MYQNGSWSCVVFAQRANFASYTDATLTMLAMRVAPFRSPRCWTRRSRRRGGGEKGTQVFPVPVDPVVPVLLHCRWHRLHGLWLLHGLQPEGRRLKPPLGTAAAATETGAPRVEEVCKDGERGQQSSGLGIQRCLPDKSPPVGSYLLLGADGLLLPTSPSSNAATSSCPCPSPTSPSPGATKTIGLKSWFHSCSPSKGYWRRWLQSDGRKAVTIAL